MKTLLITISLFIAAFCQQVIASDENSKQPYIEITINGLEELGPPLDRLATAVEQLAESDKLSEQDQQKIMAITQELHQFTGQIDASIQSAKNKASEVQQEIASSAQHIVITAISGIFLITLSIFIALYYLFKHQISPLADSTLITVTQASSTLDQLSQTAEFIAENNTPNRGKRRFARIQRIVR